jgi:hypothetical protein
MSQKWTSYPTDIRQNLPLKIMKRQWGRRRVPKAEIGNVSQILEYALDCLLTQSPWRRLKTSHRHTENWMSDLVTVKYRSDPIMLRYSFWSTCSPSLSASSVVVVLIGVTMALESSMLNFLTMSLVYFAWCTNVPSLLEKLLSVTICLWRC